jgi:hypothetical protein
MHCTYISRVKIQKYIKSKTVNRLKKKEEAMLLYGNGFRGSILNVFTVTKEYLLF